jgi:hypothetical protein
MGHIYVSFPQVFAKGKWLKPMGIDMPRDKYKGLHGDLSENDMYVITQIW